MPDTDTESHEYDQGRMQCRARGGTVPTEEKKLYIINPYKFFTLINFLHSVEMLKKILHNVCILFAIHCSFPISFL